MQIRKSPRRILQTQRYKEAIGFRSCFKKSSRTLRKGGKELLKNSRRKLIFRNVSENSSTILEPDHTSQEISPISSRILEELPVIEDLLENSPTDLEEDSALQQISNISQRILDVGKDLGNSPISLQSDQCDEEFFSISPTSLKDFPGNQEAFEGCSASLEVRGGAASSAPLQRFSRSSSESQQSTSEDLSYRWNYIIARMGLGTVGMNNT
jgi:hypothetical protein